MSLLTVITGSAREVSAEAVAEQLQPVLMTGEPVQRCFKLVRDLIVFTDRRLLLVDKQGVTGKKIEYHTIPYKSITHFSVETAGRFDLDAELRIWVSGSGQPVQKTLSKGVDVVQIQRTLAEVVTER